MLQTYDVSIKTLNLSPTVIITSAPAQDKTNAFKDADLKKPNFSNIEELKIRPVKIVKKEDLTEIKEPKNQGFNQSVNADFPLI